MPETKSRNMRVKKEISRNKLNFSNQMLVILLLVAFIVLVLVINVVSTFALQNSVMVAELKNSVPGSGIITSDNLKWARMSQADYNATGVYTFKDGSKHRAIALWGDRNLITNVYASNFIRHDTPIYWDSLTKSTPKKDSYLYNMDGELLELSLDASQFGSLIVPGDKINVRVSYTSQDYTLPTYEQYQLSQTNGTGGSGSATSTTQAVLFDGASVVDMLNSSNNSIFDIYYKLMEQPQSVQTQELNDPNFIATITPSKFLLSVTSEEADRYMAMENANPKYMLTLLPRTSSNPILDLLSGLKGGTTGAGATK